MRTEPRSADILRISSSAAASWSQTETRSAARTCLAALATSPSMVSRSKGAASLLATARMGSRSRADRSRSGVAAPMWGSIPQSSPSIHLSRRQVRDLSVTWRAQCRSEREALRIRRRVVLALDGEAGCERAAVGDAVAEGVVGRRLRAAEATQIRKVVSGGIVAGGAGGVFALLLPLLVDLVAAGGRAGRRFELRCRLRFRGDRIGGD